MGLNVVGALEVGRAVGIWVGSGVSNAVSSNRRTMLFPLSATNKDVTSVPNTTNPQIPRGLLSADDVPATESKV
jgi:hypothetical protein